MDSRSTRGPSLGRLGWGNFHHYPRNNKLCMSSLCHRPRIRHRTSGAVWEGMEVAIVIPTLRITNFQSLPPTMTSTPNFGTSPERPVRGNCHPRIGNTLHCMSSLDHRPWIRHRTADPVWEGLKVAVVIITLGTLYIECRVWTSEHGFDTSRGPSLGNAWMAQV